MYALSSEPEARPRVLALCAGLTATLSVAVFSLFYRLETPHARPPLERLQFQVVTVPATTPPPIAEPPRPAAPIPQAAASRPKPGRPLPPTPPPVRERTPAPTFEEPAPSVLNVAATEPPETQPAAVANGLPERELVANSAATRAPSFDAPRPSRNASSKQRFPAKLVRGGAPSYPPQAKSEGIEGLVVLSITINAAGYVESASVVSGLGHGLDESALRAARETLWAPALLDGQPVRTTRRFNVRFTLQS